VHQALLHMRDDGLAPHAAVLESVNSRIRPIFMTTVTTVLGLMPLVLFPGAGSELYRGLGTVFLGGMVVSTAVTLILVPTLFSLTMDIKEGTWDRLLGHRETASDVGESPSREARPAAAVGSKPVEPVTVES
jgi:HAE1 family hydrophobic/amphiphilic exporter-1